MEADDLKFARFSETEAGLLDFAGKLRHVGRAPWDDEVVGLGQARLDFVQEMAIAFAEQVVKELVLNLGRRGALQEQEERLRGQALGMNQHG